MRRLLLASLVAAIGVAGCGSASLPHTSTSVQHETTTTTTTVAVTPNATAGFYDMNALAQSVQQTLDTTYPSHATIEYASCVLVAPQVADCTLVNVRGDTGYEQVTIGADGDSWHGFPIYRKASG